MRIGQTKRGRMRSSRFGGGLAGALLGYMPEFALADPAVQASSWPTVAGAIAAGAAVLCGWTAIRLWRKLRAYECTVAREVQARLATDERAAELARQYDEDRAGLDAILDAANVALMVIDRSLCTRQVNETAARLTGRRRIEILGLPPGEVLHCVNAIESAGGCGRGRLCAQCPLRKGIEKAMGEGTAVRVPEIAMEQRLDGKALRLLFDVMIAPLSSKDESCVLVSMTDVTERKRAEHELLLERETSRALLDATRSQSYLIDADGCILAANAEAGRVLGRPTPSLMGARFWDLFPNEAGQLRKDRFLEAKRTGKPLRFEDECRGEAFGLSYYPVLDSAGKMLYLAAHCANITDRIQTREALQLSEERFRTIAEMAGVYIWELDAQQHFTFVSEKILEVLGYGPAECIGREFVFFLPPNEVETFLNAWSGAISAGETSILLEHRALRKCGGEFWMSSHAVLRYGDDGSYLGAFGSSRDVTSRKIIELALQDSEARFRAMASAAQDAIVMIDDRGRILFWNDAGERIFGWNENEIIGRNIHTTLVPPRYTEQARKGMDLFRQTGSGPTLEGLIELSAMRKDGTEFPVELAVSSVQLDKRWCAVGLVRDITDRKRSEMELQEAIAHAQTMAQHAQRADAAKSEFLANMSHEIRTPMNGVIGMTTLLLDTALDPEQRQYAETIRASGESLLAIINDILDFSKIEAGRLELEAIDFDLLDTMADFAQLLLVRAEEKGLELAYRVSSKVPRWLRGDPGRLRQILVNLAGNAVKFTEQGEVTIAVDLERMGADHVVLRFAVRDTGIGIPANRVNSLFRSFSQGDASTTRKYGGTGLGLAISKRLAEMMEGEIGVLSEAGHGAEFWFTARFGKAFEPYADGDDGETAPAYVRGSRWLVLEGHPGTREFLRSQLADWECSCGLAGNVSEAAEALRAAEAKELPFDGIILDAEFLGPMLELRNASHDPALSGKIRLILKAGRAQRQAIQRARDAGFDAVLLKPVIQPASLLECLRMAIEGGPVPGRSTEPEFLPLSPGGTNRRLRILVAEDNVVNQQVARGLLEKMGHRVDCVANGAEAVEAVRSLPYDIVLMDCQMPEMDGFEATAAIRALEGGATHTPIAALTANAMKGDREKCLQSGMDEYLSKPLRARELALLLDRLFPNAGRAPSPQKDTEWPAATAFSPMEFADRIGSNLALMYDILRSASTLLPKMADDFGQSVRARNMEGARRHIHSIKGMVSNIEAGPLHHLSVQIERALAEENWSGADEALTALHAGAQSLVNEIDGFLGALPAAKRG